MFHHHDHNQCQHNAIATAEAICAERGARLTEQRKQVLALIWESHRPVKAYDILERLADNKSAPAPKSAPTNTPSRLQPPVVYRALDFLMEHGLIHRIDSLNAFTGCHHPDADHNCFFLICSDCGNADECCAPALKSAITSTAASHNFTPARITLEVSGQCATCAAQ